MAQVAAENERLLSLAAKANGSKNQLADLLKLRAEAESLRNQTGGIVTATPALTIATAGGNAGQTSAGPVKKADRESKAVKLPGTARERSTPAFSYSLFPRR